jgi:hypothetical protein
MHQIVNQYQLNQLCLKQLNLHRHRQQLYRNCLKLMIVKQKLANRLHRHRLLVQFHHHRHQQPLEHQQVIQVEVGNRGNQTKYQLDSH